MSWILRGANSGSAVAMILLRMHRTLCLVRVLSKEGGTRVVIVWVKCMVMELFSTQVLWPMTGVSSGLW